MKTNRLQHFYRRILLLSALAGAGLCLSTSLHAQQHQKSGGSPLDTLMRTRLWADVPDAKDFVRQSRPPAEVLEYQPTAGADPQRPAPRTKTELDALRNELESAGAHNEAKAGRRQRATPPAQRARLEKSSAN
jgi:hypothetical protein